MFVSEAYAVDGNRAMSQYIHDHWGPEQGFPRGPVYAITQTTDGYLWIGTDAGLVRFDGLKFQLIVDRSDSFPITGVLGLAGDDDGNLWVRLQGPTLLRYRDGVFEDANLKLGMPYSTITGMSRTRQGTVVISRLQQGVVIYRHGRFELNRAAVPLARSPVLSVAQTPDGDVWMGTRDAGLFRLTGKQVSAISDGLPDTKINCLLPDGERDLWVGTDNGIVRWNGTEFDRSPVPASLRGFQALAMTKDRDANIWVGTDSRGLLRLKANGVASLASSDNRPKEAVTAIFEDREGNIWSGSANGIERFRDSVFVTYSLEEGLPSDGSVPVFVDWENRLCFLLLPAVFGG
jgi:ligand-binding sensor domain-containing protein